MKALIFLTLLIVYFSMILSNQIKTNFSLEEDIEKYKKEIDGAFENYVKFLCNNQTENQEIIAEVQKEINLIEDANKNKKLRKNDWLTHNKCLLISASFSGLYLHALSKNKRVVAAASLMNVFVYSFIAGIKKGNERLKEEI